MPQVNLRGLFTAQGLTRWLLCPPSWASLPSFLFPGYSFSNGRLSCFCASFCDRQTNLSGLVIDERFATLLLQGGQLESLTSRKHSFEEPWGVILELQKTINCTPILCIFTVTSCLSDYFLQQYTQEAGLASKEDLGTEFHNCVLRTYLH